MKIFYHNDLDGRCAAFWVMCKADTDNETIELNEINYGMKFPIETICKDEDVYIVDYSIEPSEMDELLHITKNVVWIDHHISAINKYKDFGKDIKGIRLDGVAGCMLTYCYLEHMTKHGNTEYGVVPFDMNMVKEAPYFTHLIADYDVWKFQFGEYSKKFHVAFYNLHNTAPTSHEWVSLLEDIDGSYIDDIILEGNAVLKYKQNYAKDYCKSLGFETEFEGHRCYALNIGLAGSDWVESVNEYLYEMFILFAFNGTDWTYSLRSSIVDCSKIALKYGGGGHKGAAGFRSDKLLIKKK